MRRTRDERMCKKEFRMRIVNRIKDLTPRERARVIEEILKERHNIPFSRRESLSRTTIYRWLKEFRESADAGSTLMGKVRCDLGRFRALTEKQEAALLRWRVENAYRTAADLQEELMNHESTCAYPPPSLSTIVRFLRAKGLARSVLVSGSKPQPKIRLAFEAEYPQQIWMADTKGPDVYVVDPKDSSRRVLARPICILDDHARYIVAGLYVINENEFVIMKLFCQAVLLYGIPEILYVDRGSSYRGKNLKRAAGLIGCNVIYTPKADAEAKGKIEKVLRTVHERFEHEMKASGKEAVTVEEYNQYLQAYIAQDYHRTVHSATRQTPEERFFAFPPNLRRWISKDNLMLIFLPCRTASVSKTGLIRVNNRKYLAQDALLWGKKVEVRYDHSDLTRVYVWYEDRYYGEANVFMEENDFLQREALLEKIQQRPEIIIPDAGQVPVYSRLERQLARYREEMENFDLNEQLAQSRQKKEQIRAAMLSGKPTPAPKTPVESGAFGVDAFLYLLMKLLRKKFTPSERLAVHTLWNAVGPIEEKLVRKTVGRLLGEEHPVEDVKGYLEEIRLAILTKNNNE